MTYPGKDDIERASHLQLAKWYRFLPSPENTEQIVALERIIDRFKELGGMTPTISKQIGWG